MGGECGRQVMPSGVKHSLAPEKTEKDLLHSTCLCKWYRLHKGWIVIPPFPWPFNTQPLIPQNLTHTLDAYPFPLLILPPPMYSQPPPLTIFSLSTPTSEFPPLTPLTPTHVLFASTQLQTLNSHLSPLDSQSRGPHTPCPYFVISNYINMLVTVHV